MMYEELDYRHSCPYDAMGDYSVFSDDKEGDEYMDSSPPDNS